MVRGHWAEGGVGPGPGPGPAPVDEEAAGE